MNGPQLQFLPLVLVVGLASSCVQPRSEAGAVTPASDPELDGRRAHLRARFEAARRAASAAPSEQPPGHGARGHGAFGCPHCADPMAAEVPVEARITGPAPVWNG